MRELSLSLLIILERVCTEVGIDLAGRPQILSSVKFRIRLLTRSFTRSVRAAFSGNRGQTESEADETR